MNAAPLRVLVVDDDEDDFVLIRDLLNDAPGSHYAFDWCATPQQGLEELRKGAHDVYLVPRKSYMMGRWIRGSGWYPNFRQPQLFRSGAMRYTLEPVHEGYENLSGKPLGRLTNAIWQFPFRNIEEVIKKMNRYSSLGVPKLAGKRVSMASALGHGLWSFIKHYIFKLGFRDGWAGFVIAFGNFEGTFYRYAKRYEETQNWQPPESKPLRRPPGS